MPSFRLPTLAAAFACLLLACGRPGAEPAGPAASLPPLAVWTYRDLTGSAKVREACFAFARRNGVRELYLGASGLLPRGGPALAALLAEAQARELRVVLVLGRAEWVRPAQREAALAAVRAVRDFDRAQARGGGPRLAGLQLDVEPHTLPDWGSQGTQLSTQYLDLLEAARAELQEGPPLHAAIPVWWQGRKLNRAGRVQPLSTWVARVADTTVLMDYRNRVDAIVEAAEGPLAAGDALGKPVVVGLAAHCDRAPETAATSFCRLGDRALRQALRESQARLARHRSLAGFAVFTWEDWEALAR